MKKFLWLLFFLPLCQLAMDRVDSRRCERAIQENITVNRPPTNWWVRRMTRTPPWLTWRQTWIFKEGISGTSVWVLIPLPTFVNREIDRLRFYTFRYGSLDGLQNVNQISISCLTRGVYLFFRRCQELRSPQRGVCLLTGASILRSQRSLKSNWLSAQSFWTVLKSYTMRVPFPRVNSYKRKPKLPLTSKFWWRPTTVFHWVSWPWLSFSCWNLLMAFKDFTRRWHWSR